MIKLSIKVICSVCFIFDYFNIYSQENNAQIIAKEFQPTNYTITHSPIKTKLWNIENVIIAFYETPIYHKYENMTYEHNLVKGYLLIPNNNTFKKILIDEYEDDNVDTEILSVFFANADNDKEKELIILTGNTHRLEYLYNGTEYSVYIYDNISTKDIPEKLSVLTNPKFDVFNINFEGTLDDKNHKAKFKTAEAVKKELKKLGF